MTSAIVIGGGIAGLCSVSALSQHVDKIVLIDQDELFGSNIVQESVQETARRRGGVQQYTMPHILLAGGAIALEELLPGIQQECMKRGAMKLDVGEGAHVYDFGGVYPKARFSIDAFAMSRRLLNQTLQDMVVEQVGGKLEILERSKVKGLVVSSTKGEVEGSKKDKKLRVKGVKLADGETLLADMVIVADGRRSQLPRWLENCKVQLPKVKKIDCKIVYAAGWFRLPPDFDHEKEPLVQLVLGRPASTRSGVVINVEDNMTQVILAGVGGDACPLDHEGFLEFARSLPDPSIYDLLRRCEPVTRPSRFSGLYNAMHGYHQAKNMPQGLFVLGFHPSSICAGDAFLKFNPIYGQGQSIAAMQALAFRKLLEKHLRKAHTTEAKLRKIHKLEKKVHREMFKVSSVAWDLAVTEDVKWVDRLKARGIEGVSIEGDVKSPSKLMLYYSDAIGIACQKNAKLYCKSAGVFHLVSPPTALMSPGFAIKVLLTSRKKSKAQAMHQHSENGVGKHDVYTNGAHTVSS